MSQADLGDGAGSIGLGFGAGGGTPSGPGPGGMPGRSGRRKGPAIEVVFPVTPMLDMAFQLMAFFVLTFQAPSGETRIDLYLPAAPAALPEPDRDRPGGPRARRADLDLENDLIVRAEAGEAGGLRSLALGTSTVPDLATLADRARRYAEVLGDRPLRVRLVADETLRYEEVARIVAALSDARVASIRFADTPVGEGRP